MKRQNKILKSRPLTDGEQLKFNSSVVKTFSALAFVFLLLFATSGLDIEETDDLATIQDKIFFKVLVWICITLAIIFMYFELLIQMKIQGTYYFFRISERRLEE